VKLEAVVQTFAKKQRRIKPRTTQNTRMGKVGVTGLVSLKTPQTRAITFRPFRAEKSLPELDWSAPTS
jgi:hypothetical protein